MTALLGIEFTFLIDNLPSSLPSIQSGKFKALAVTSEERVAELPDVPTMKEAGVDNMVVTAWFGLLAPAGTPDDVVDKLYQSAKKALESDDIKARFANMGGKPGGNTPAEFAELITNQQNQWAEIVEAANLKMD